MFKHLFFNMFNMKAKEIPGNEINKQYQELLKVEELIYCNNNNPLLNNIFINTKYSKQLSVEPESIESLLKRNIQCKLKH